MEEGRGGEGGSTPHTQKAWLGRGRHTHTHTFITGHMNNITSTVINGHHHHTHIVIILSSERSTDTSLIITTINGNGHHHHHQSHSHHHHHQTECHHHHHHNNTQQQHNNINTTEHTPSTTSSNITNRRTRIHVIRSKGGSHHRHRITGQMLQGWGTHHIPPTTSPSPEGGCGVGWYGAVKGSSFLLPGGRQRVGTNRHKGRVGNVTTECIYQPRILEYQ